MASEISVERQFRFQCSCGAAIVTGERTVTCPECGHTLGVHRVRRRRQHRRDSVTYYGSALPVRRAESHGQEPNPSAATPNTPIGPRWAIPAHRVEKRRTEAVTPSTPVSSRLLVFLKSILAKWSDLLKASRVEKDSQRTNQETHVEAQEVVLEVHEEPRGPGVVGEPLIRPLRAGMHVKVRPTRPDGKPHPHAGKTGRITRFADAYSEPYWLGPPSAMVKLDLGIWQPTFIWVSVECLEVLSDPRWD